MQENLAKTTKKQSQNKAKTRQMSFGAKLFFMNNVFWQEFYCTQAQCSCIGFVRSGSKRLFSAALAISFPISY
jgi:hypothetical protein